VSRVLVVGSANVDFTVALPRLPLPGETVTGGTLLVNHGGKGANQAVAARRLGAEVRLIACLGDDPAGHGIRDGLVTEGIDVTGLVWIPQAATGTALIVVDAEGRNQIAVAPGANRYLSVGLARRGVADIRWADVVACQLETPLPTVKWVLEEARRSGITTILNPAPVDMGGLDRAPQTPQRSDRPGEAGAVLDLGTGSWAPQPPQRSDRASEAGAVLDLGTGSRAPQPPQGSDRAGEAGAVLDLGTGFPAPQPPQPSDHPGEAVALLDLCPLVDYLTPNAGEAARLSGVAVTDRASAAEAAETLRRRGVATVVVTLGADGALVVSDAGVAHVPGVAVTAIDTTAAGDTFNAALAVGLGEGRVLADVLRFANAAAALACTRRGAQPSLPSRSEVDRLL